MEASVWSFDGTERASCTVAEPAVYHQLFDTLTAHPRVIPRGAGLSYCTAGAGNESVAVSSRHFNRIREFDTVAGVIDVESGVTVGTLTRVASGRGWIPPVLPGHPSITVGGCIGFNVHGKSQRECGNFRNCIESLELFHPDHGRIRCSRTENPDVFDVTVGGFGMTGFVTSARLRLDALIGGTVARESIPVYGLEHAVEVMETFDSGASVYSWNDLSRSGDGFGAGLVYVDRIEIEPSAWGDRDPTLSAETRRRLPFSLFNRVTTPFVNRGYRFIDRLRAGPTRLPLKSGVFPIAGREVYYRLFGRRGLREYQALVPRATWSDVSGALRKMLRAHGLAPTLGSLKLFSGRRSLLDFCGDGVCFALDVPAVPRALELFSEIDRLVVEAVGIANLSKDGRLSTATIREMYPGWNDFVDTVRDFDPDRRFRSTLGDRVFG